MMGPYDFFRNMKLPDEDDPSWDFPSASVLQLVRDIRGLRNVTILCDDSSIIHTEETAYRCNDPTCPCFEPETPH